MRQCLIISSTWQSWNILAGKKTRYFSIIQVMDNLFSIQSNLFCPQIDLLYLEL